MSGARINVFLRSSRALVKECASLKRELRRRYLMYFRKDYVRTQMRKRRGECGRHSCCSLLFLHSFYSRHCRRCLKMGVSAECLLWSDLPEECRIYPLDEKDKIPQTRGYCNFYWEE